MSSPQEQACKQPRMVDKTDYFRNDKSIKNKTNNNHGELILLFHLKTHVRVEYHLHILLNSELAD